MDMTPEEIREAAETEIRRVHNHGPSDTLCNEDLCEMQAFIKGAYWMREYGELKQSPRWVKASERLPQRGECILRVTGGEKLDRKTICLGWLHSDKDQIDATKGKVTLAYSGQSLSKVEWLDESESPGSQEAVEWVGLLTKQIAELEKYEGKLELVKDFPSAGSIVLRFEKNSYWLKIEKQSTVCTDDL